jgi:hypothetical protein
VRAGGFKAYAVTGEMRLAAAPDIPTFDEMGLSAGGIDTPSWHGLFAPSGTPKEVIGKLNAAVVDALADLGACLSIRRILLAKEVRVGFFWPHEQDIPCVEDR